MSGVDMGPKGSRMVSSLTPDQLAKYQNYVKDTSERIAGQSNEQSVPAVSGMMCLKLFMSIEIERYRQIVEDKNLVIEELEKDKNRLEVEL